MIIDTLPFRQNFTVLSDLFVWLRLFEIHSDGSMIDGWIDRFHLTLLLVSYLLSDSASTFKCFVRTR